jgi:hypothetical protein
MARQVVHSSPEVWVTKDIQDRVPGETTILPFDRPLSPEKATRDLEKMHLDLHVDDDVTIRVLRRIPKIIEPLKGRRFAIPKFLLTDCIQLLGTGNREIADLAGRAINALYQGEDTNDGLRNSIRKAFADSNIALPVTLSMSRNVVKVGHVFKVTIELSRYFQYSDIEIPFEISREPANYMISLSGESLTAEKRYASVSLRTEREARVELDARISRPGKTIAVAEVFSDREFAGRSALEISADE